MTEESQAMVKKVGLIGLGGVVFLAFSKMIFPMVLLAGDSYFVWRVLFKILVMADFLVYLLVFGMVALLYTLAMAQLLKDEAGYFQDCLDRRSSRRQGNRCELSR